MKCTQARWGAVAAMSCSRSASDLLAGKGGWAVFHAGGGGRFLKALGAKGEIACFLLKASTFILLLLNLRTELSLLLETELCEIQCCW